MKRILKVLVGAVIVLVVAAVIGAAWYWQQFNASIPLYDGRVTLEGLYAPVVIERDDLGVVTIHSTDELDEARALGFVHAQERFFQMDLLRRSASGELAALVGRGAVRIDEQRRRHRLRRTAERAFAAYPDRARMLLEAYTDGVNEGLRQLNAAPFEYLLLRTAPEPWRPEDSLLVSAAMYFDLQSGTALHKRNELVARRILPPALADFLYPRFDSWDAPLVGDAAPLATVPGADVYDLRELPSEWFDEVTPPGATVPFGSNNWAVAGSHTASGRGLLANDMHLGLQVPSIWFRASLRRGDGHVTGATLPGVPAVVVGSNGRIAWGFTNSYGDWLELIEVEVDPEDEARYRTPGGWRRFETVTETIEVAGAAARTVQFIATEWGPVLGMLHDGTPYAVQWVAHHPEGYTPSYLDIGAGADVESALAIGQRAGMPAQNLVVADAEGRIGWTIMGPLPRRVGEDALVSRSGDGSAWNGWLAPDEYPVITDPESGRLWTANARVVDGEALAKIGDGGYALGARARQIRDRLFSIEAATPADMLAIQLDDEALFYDHWRTALLATLDEATVAGDARFVAVRDAVQDWGGHAAVDSVGFRLVRGWRNRVISDLLSALTAEVRQHDSNWAHRSFRNEHWAWPLLESEPPHLLPPGHEDWHTFRVAALAQLLDDLAVQRPEQLASRTWGELNTVRIQHPLSQAVPRLSRWLDMPARALPGDGNMPRVQTVRFGASQRMAVSPGDEFDGYFHMPGGQSGHPRSPFYGAGHADWEEGRPTPFMPGTVRHSLELQPSSAPAPRVSMMSLPSGEGAVAPNLFRSAAGDVLMSWIEPRGDGHALRFSSMDAGGHWSPPRDIATGSGWFVNWADFPAIVETDDGMLVAHWLQKSGPATYAYDVMVTRSTDRGESWSPGTPAHEDGTQTEHGFVSLLPDGDSVRLVWLDGRETAGGRGTHVHGGHDQGNGRMALRTRTLSGDGSFTDEVLLDDSVCDCCQTAAAQTADGVFVAYRNRTDDELRDIWSVRWNGDGWSEPQPVHEDGWHIAGCPVNGPAVAADGNDLIVTWFTAADGIPQVLVARSGDGGASFGAPVRVDGGMPVGRVGAVMLGDGRAAISWLEETGDAAEIRVRPVDADGTPGRTIVVARSNAARASGFPRIVRDGGGGLSVVWTSPGDPSRLRGARVTGLD